MTPALRSPPRSMLGRALLVLLATLALVAAVHGASPEETSSAPFLLTSAHDVVRRVSAVYYPRPTAILFTDPHSRAPLTTAARESVQRLRDTFPATMASVHAFHVSTSDAASVQLFQVLVPSGSLPCLALFGSAVMSGMTVPGAVISVAPAFVPVMYGGSWSNSTAMRQWLLSETPTQYSDPVSYRTAPAMHLILEVPELAALVTTLEQDVRVDGSRSSVPEYVLFAYAHLTAHGSESLVAAVSSLAAQAGERVLAVVTESAELASAVFGPREAAELPPWHQIALLRFADVRAAVETTEGTSGSHSSSNSNSNSLSLEALAKASVVAHATVAQGSEDDKDEAHLLAASAHAVAAVLAEVHALPSQAEDAAASALLMPGVAAPRSTSATTALQAWQRALSRATIPTASASPLRQLTSTAELQHELRAGYNAIKIVFFLRESDTIHFSGYRKLAETFARRACASSVVTYKSLAKKDVVWRPPFLIKAFWVDAERHAEFAAQLRVSTVPDVAVLLPISERVDKPASAADAALVKTADRKVGVHHLTVHDLTVVDTTTSPVPQTAKEAELMFPTEPDMLIRFLANPQFTTRATFNLHVATLASLTMGAADGRHAAHATLADVLPASVDRQYYPSAAEEPHAYLHSLFTGAVTLPLFDAAEYQEAARQRAAAALTPPTPRHGTAAAEAGSHAAISEKDRERKATLQRELEARQQAKAARIQEKARKDAEAREAAAKKLQEDVRTALHADNRDNKDGSRGDESGAATAQGRFAVRRPSMSAPAGHADGLAQYRWWEAQAEQMAAKYIKVIDGMYLHLRAALELGDF